MYQGSLAAFAALLLVAACDPITVGDPPPAPASPTAPAPGGGAPPVEDPGDAPCATLTRAACLRSVICTLDAPAGEAAGQYRCRPAEGNCEIGLAQADPSFQDRCADRTGCRWQPASCYCHCRGSGRAAVPDGDEAEPCDCECGGGPPERCSPR